MNTFITFGDSRIKPSVNRVKAEAKNFFDKDWRILAYTEKNLKPDFVKMHKAKFKLRGYGYWIWKSYLVRQVLDSMNMDDLLVYVDAGCTLNVKGKERFNDYIESLWKSKCGMIAFSHDGLKERCWTKADLFVATNTLGKPEITETEQLASGMILLRKCDDSIRFVDEWYHLCNDHFDLITDKESVHSNFEGFVEHRHDQSALSVIMKKYNPILYSVNETWVEDNWEDRLIHYPIWATRRKQLSRKEILKRKYKHKLERLKYKILNITEQIRPKCS